jgi:cob(I)alamin adenosyltransferase
MSDSSVYDNMRDEFAKGYLQVYTGDGKGKTTAAIGLSVRALGAGMSVFFAQFIKGAKYSEFDALGKLAPNGSFTHKQYGRGCFIMREPEQADIDAAVEGLADALAEMKSGKYRLVVLDEANVAVALKLLKKEDLLDFASQRPENTELLITGRGATDELKDIADLVTEMREIKHYYEKGVKARRGIES